MYMWWATQLLIFKLEQNQVGITQQFPLDYEHENDKFLNSTVTGDESYFIPNLTAGDSQQTMEFHHKRSPAIKK